MVEEDTYPVQSRMTSPPPTSDPNAFAPPAGPPMAMWFKVLLLVLISTGVGYLSALKLNLGQIPGIVIGSAICGVGTFAMMKLRGAPREMGLTFCLKFFSVTAYKVLNVTLVLWLSHDLGYTKEAALGLIMVWSIVMSIMTILAGSITDALGLRRTLIIGVTLSILTRLVMILTTNQTVALACGLFPLAVGEALCTPVLVAALRRFTSPSQRSVAFSVFYAIMNFGFMVAYFIFDGVRESLASHGQITLPLATTPLSDYRTLLLASMLLEVMILPLVLLLRRGAEMTAQGLRITPEIIKHPDAGLVASFCLTIRDAFLDVVRLFSALIHQSGFYRLLVFLLMIGLLKIVFNAMDYVFPPFALQELGPEARVGRFNAINGILILVLAPALGLMTQRFSAYVMVIVGGFVTAFSFIFMVLPPSVFQGLADGWLGNAIGHGYMEMKGSVHPYYIMIVCWQIVFSVGEAIYSPRVYEYAASIAPKGQEASYASLSYIPLLFGKLVTGAAIGGLLTKYYPDTGARDPSTMWLLIGLMVLVAPVCLLVFQRFIRVKEQGRET
jgi:MFS family permease